MLSFLECLLADGSVADAVLNELACLSCCGSGGMAKDPLAARVLCIDLCFFSERILLKSGTPLSSERALKEPMLASESTRDLSFRTALVKA